MKRILTLAGIIVSFIIVMCFAVHAQDAVKAKPPAPAAPETRPLPKPIADRLAQLDQKTTQLQQDLQTLQLLRDNLVLTAALEMGLSKKDLEEMELGRDAGGQFAFVRALKPKAEPKPALSIGSGATPKTAAPR